MNNKILIVEDESKIASLLSDYLKRAGFEPSCLDNGLDVVPWVRQNAPALILLDVMLPGRDGMEVC
ncbi:MAG: response regulator, partial [Dissulfurimicrobium sp.]